MATYAAWSQEAVQDPNIKEGMYQVFGAVSFGSPGVWGQCHLGPRHFQASNCVVVKAGPELLGGFWGERQLDQLGADFFSVLGTIKDDKDINSEVSFILRL